MKIYKQFEFCTYVCLWDGYTCFYDRRLQDNLSTCAEKIEIAVEHQRERQTNKNDTSRNGGIFQNN